MLTFIVHHWCRPACIADARRRIDQNAADMAGRPGFVMRQRLERPEDPLLVTTLTTWADEASYAAWQQYKKSRDDQSGGKPDFYEKIVTERFYVRAGGSKA